jgi:hypothetical protein
MTSQQQPTPSSPNNRVKLVLQCQPTLGACAFTPLHRDSADHWFTPEI